MLLHIPLFTFLFSFVSCQTQQQELLLKIVDYIVASQLYQLPKDNADMFETSDATLYDKGTYDFIIVGGGASGCVLANRLTEILGWTVLVIEAGDRGNDVTDVPAMLVYSFNSPYNWGYYSVPQTTCCQGMREKQCAFPRGKGLGGSSLINAIFYVRGNRNDYDEWERLGNRGWSFEDCLPYFKKSEHADFPNADPTYHGTSGLLHVNHTDPSSLINTTFFNAAVWNMQLNIIDYNGKDQIGAAKMQYAIDFNKREESGAVFIVPIENRSNLEISLNSFAIKIVTEGDRATGVEYVKDGKRYLAKARKEVLITAGAINSAQLLLLSGIGPKRDLKKLGIEVKKNLPVGKNLMDHPLFLGLMFSTKRRAPTPTLPEAVDAYFNGDTPLTRCFGGENVVFVNVNDPNSTVPDIEFVSFPQPRGGDVRKLFNMNDENTNAYNKVDPATSVHVLVDVLQPKSTGKVYLKSKSPIDFPQIDLGLLSDKGNVDIDIMYKGVQYAIDFFTGKEFGTIDSYISLVVPECEQLHELFSKDYWYCAFRQLTTTYYHPSGTTKMGRSRSSSVVNSALVVHGMQNLRVAGEGIFPTPVSGHNYAPCLMIGEKLADIIKQHYGVL